MEYRKTAKSNLENKKEVFFLIGALLILTVTFASFSIKSYTDNAYSFEMQVDDEMMELPPVTTPPPPPPPPPPAEAPPVEPELKLVEDEVKTEDPKFDDKDIADIEINDSPIGEAPSKDEVLEDIPMTFVSNMPTLPECAGLKSNLERDQCTKANIVKKIGENFEMPEIAKELGQEGTVYVKFTVDKTGAVTNVEILKGVNEHIDKEAIRSVKKLPKFNPGMNLDKPVSIYYNIPIRITIN